MHEASSENQPCHECSLFHNYISFTIIRLLVTIMASFCRKVRAPDLQFLSKAFSRLYIPRFSLQKLLSCKILFPIYFKLGCDSQQSNSHLITKKPLHLSHPTKQPHPPLSILFFFVNNSICPYNTKVCLCVSIFLSTLFCCCFQRASLTPSFWKDLLHMHESCE